MRSEARKQAGGHPRIQVKRKSLTRKKPLLVPAVALSKPEPSTESLHAHNEADGHLKTHVRKKELHGKNHC
jgi:hypothetical protein